MLISILSLIKSIIFNFRFLPLQEALKLPFWVRIGTKCSVKGKIQLEEEARMRFAIKIGGTGSAHISPNKLTYFFVGKDAKVIFKGKASIGLGSSVRVDREGVLSVGPNFSTNRNCNISCSHNMVFEDDVLFGWNIQVRDTDGHQVYISEKPSERCKKVILHEHVWVGSFSDILKGAEIGKGSVVAWRSCVLSKFQNENVLLGGYPAKILRTDVSWEK